MREDQVYVLAKRGLVLSGWTVLAGQPPRGTNHLPVVEIKDPLRSGKGSGGAYKPDLVAWFPPHHLLIVECKPQRDDSDAAKLRAILGDIDRQRELWEEIVQRGLLRRADIEAPAFKAVHFLGALAHGSGTMSPMPDLGVIICKACANGVAWLPALAWPPSLVSSLP